jgi:hypothetical protein
MGICPVVIGTNVPNIHGFLSNTENPRANHIFHLLGIANFILFLNPDDQDARNCVEILRKYVRREE